MKRLLFFLSLLVVLLFLPFDCHAYTYEDAEEAAISTPFVHDTNLYPYAFIGGNGSQFGMIVSNKPMLVNDSRTALGFLDETNCQTYSLVTNDDGATWHWQLGRAYTVSNNLNFWGNFRVPLRSTYNVYDRNGNLFFQHTPVWMMNLSPGMILSPLLVSLGGLAKLLIPFLICVLAFWKGWGTLLKLSKV